MASSSNNRDASTKQPLTQSNLALLHLDYRFIRDITPSYHDISRHEDGLIQSNRERLFENSPTLKEARRRSDTSAAFEAFVNAAHRAAEEIDPEEKCSLKLYKTVECSTAPSERAKILSIAWPDNATTLKAQEILEDESQLLVDSYEGAESSSGDVGGISDTYRNGMVETMYGDYVEVDSVKEDEEIDPSTGELLGLYRRARVVQPDKLRYKKPKMRKRKRESPP